MSDAAVNPVRRRRTLESADTSIQQHDPLPMPGLGDELERAAEIVVASEEEIKAEHAARLAFAEEPVRILVHPSGDKNAQIVHDAWVNGKGAEVFVNGQWVEFGCIPVGIEVITKRKYVEVLARKKRTNVRTEVIKQQDSEQNLVHRDTIHECPFSVIEDRSPYAREWLQGLMRTNA